MTEPSYAARESALSAARPGTAGSSPWTQLIDAASEPYKQAGPFAYCFARGKLRRDPVFRAILEGGLLSGRKRLLDLGCGQGLLAAWLQAAVRCHDAGRWPTAWPPPPRPQVVRGIELMRRDVARARRALGAAFEVLQSDLRAASFGSTDAAVLLDVLHYMPVAWQLDTLRRLRTALPPGGLLLLRVGDAACGLRFRITQWCDRMIMLARGHGFVATHCHSIAGWNALLLECGFESRSVWMSQGTPFANVLLIAHTR